MYSLYINNSNSPNKTVNSTGNSVTCSFNPAIQLNPDKKYEMRLLQANIVYCQPNITSANNQFSYTYNSTVYTHTFPTGLYQLSDISNQIARWCTTDTGRYALFSLTGLDQTSQVIVFFQMSGSSIDCTIPNCVMSIIGFPASSGVITAPSDGYVTSPTNAVLNSLQEYLVSCNVINGVYQNSQLSNILGCVPINVLPSQTVQYQPQHPPHCSIFVSRIDSLTITILNQNGEPTDFSNDGLNASPENWNLTITVSEFNPINLS